MWFLSCNDCEQWVNDRGVIARFGNGEPKPRARGAATPCWECPKIPPGAPKCIRRYAQEPTDRTRAVLAHYLECRAVGQWPDDPIVRRNAAIIRGIMDQVEANRIEGLAEAVTMVATLAMKGR